MEKKHTKEYSVLLGAVYAAFLGGLTVLMDKIPVPGKDSTLWVLMAGFYILLVLISIFFEKLIEKKIEIKRTLYYATAQLLILALIVVLAVFGSKAGEEYYNSKELSYAMAFVFTELVLFLYHLGRMVVLHVLRSSEEKHSSKGKKHSPKKGAKQKRTSGKK